MKKPFCKGCKNWVRTEDYMADRIWYCSLFNEWDLKYRKLFCNGKYKTTRQNQQNNTDDGKQ